VTGAIAANPLGFLVAFGGGILSFLSPCVLPLVPGYLSIVTGLSARQLAGDTDVDGGAVTVMPLRPLLMGIGLFVAGFTVVFVALGATASGLGSLLHAHRVVLDHVAGGVVVVMGLVLLATALPFTTQGTGKGWLTTMVVRLTGELRFGVRSEPLGRWAAPVVGMAFAFAWTPCIGPILGAVLALAGARATLLGGVWLLVAYSLGLAVPFLATGLAFGRLTGFYAHLRRRLWVLSVVSGVVLVAFGVLLLAGQLPWLSHQFTRLLNDLGLHRLTTS
jgi:cytochrome c-type biogenesis protein